MYVTAHDPPESVQEPDPENDPEPLLEKVTVQDGVLAVPGAVSLTVAVHVVGSPTLREPGVHDTAVVVVRRGIVVQPEKPDVLKTLSLPGWAEGSAVVLVAVAVTTCPGATGVTLAVKPAAPEPFVDVVVEPRNVCPCPTPAGLQRGDENSSTRTLMLGRPGRLTVPWTDVDEVAGVNDVIDGAPMLLFASSAAPRPPAPIKSIPRPALE
jgi:hypothetical protein